MPGVPLIIPSETLAREFDAKLLLGCIAAVHGMRAIVGGKLAIHERILSLPRSIYVAKDLRAGSRTMLEIIERLGHVIVGWDEEGLVTASMETYHKTRVSAAVMPKLKRFFAWGAENARLIRAHPDYPEMPIEITGNPRADMMRPELRGFYAGEVAELRARYGDYLLVSGNFGFVNHYIPALNKQSEHYKPRRRDREADAVHRDFVRQREVIFRHFLAMVPRLAEAFPETTIVLRPHPSENHQPWREAAGGFANVVVENRGSAVPWLMGARCMIHNSCTTGVEATLLGVPAVAYRPVVADDLDPVLPNLVSRQVLSEAELVPTVSEILASGADLAGADEAQRRAILEHHVAALEGPLAAERIASSLLELGQSGALAARVPIVRRAEGHLLAWRRRMRRSVRERQPDTRSNRGYLRHKFPGVSLEDLRDRIARLQAVRGGFDALRVRALGDDIFELSV